jgi:hypothetical protein
LFLQLLQRNPPCGEGELTVFTAILMMMLVLAPVLIPATITAFHALAGIRRRRTPITASA